MNTLKVYPKVRMCMYVASSLVLLIHFICKCSGPYFVDYIISTDGRDLRPRLGDGMKGRESSFLFCVHVRGYDAPSWTLAHRLKGYLLIFRI